MSSVNKVIIVGRLGQDPEIRTFDNGGKIATISVATSEKWTDKNTGEPREHTEWHKCVFQDRKADVVAQWLCKGSLVYIEGSIRTRKWTDNNGIDRYSTEIKAHALQMLGGKQDNQGQPQAQYQGQQGQAYNPYQQQQFGQAPQQFGQSIPQPPPQAGYQQPPSIPPEFIQGVVDDNVPF